MADPQIVNNTAQQRFELKLGGHTASLFYTRERNTLRLIHTEVPEALQGHGVGSQLVGRVLNLAQQQGLTIIPSCPFVADYLKRHREFLPLVDAAHRRLIDTGD